MSLPIRKTIMLTVTHDCNLSCVYCYEGYKSTKFMTLSEAQEALLRHITTSETYDEVQIDFFGGETFLVFNLIQELFDWTCNRNWPKPFIFFATSNGTLIHNEIQKWLSKNKDRFVVGLSLDGTKQMHDMNRSGSFDSIDWKFFLDTWPRQPIKMTISNETLPMMAEGLQFIHSLGFKIEGNLAHGLDWSNKKNISMLSEQLDKLITYW